MPLIINGQPWADGEPVIINGVTPQEIKCNGVTVWRNITDVTLPQFTTTTDLAVWLEANYPGATPVRITNNLTQPSLNSGNFGSKVVELINNGEIRGLNPSSWALTVSSTMKLTNNGWIRGAGGNGGHGGLGGTGGNGGVGGTGAKGADISCPAYDSGNVCHLNQNVNHTSCGTWNINNTSIANNTTIRAPNGQTVSRSLNGTTTATIDGRSCSVTIGLLGSCPNNSLYRATIPARTNTGGAGGGGGAGGTSGGGGGGGGTAGVGQSYSTTRSNGTGGGGGSVGGGGSAGAGGSPSLIAGGNSGHTGGTGGAKGTGGTGGAGGNGGDWAVAGIHGHTGAVGNTGATGAVGGGGGTAGGAGAGGSAGGGGTVNGGAGASITGAGLLTGDSNTGNVNGTIIQ